MGQKPTPAEQRIAEHGQLNCSPANYVDSQRLKVEQEYLIIRNSNVFDGNKVEQMKRVELTGPISVELMGSQVEIGEQLILETDRQIKLFKDGNGYTVVSHMEQKEAHEL